MQDAAQNSFPRCARRERDPRGIGTPGSRSDHRRRHPKDRLFRATLPPALSRSTGWKPGCQTRGAYGAPPTGGAWPAGSTPGVSSRPTGDASAVVTTTATYCAAGVDLSRDFSVPPLAPSPLHPPPSHPPQAPEVRNTSPGWKLEGRGRPASVRCPSPVQVRGRPRPLSPGRAGPSRPPSPPHLWSPNLSSSSPSLPSRRLPAAGPRGLKWRWRPSPPLPAPPVKSPFVLPSARAGRPSRVLTG